MRKLHLKFENKIKSVATIGLILFVSAVIYGIYVGGLDLFGAGIGLATMLPIWIKNGNEFKELTQSEIEKLTAEEMGNYLNAQRKHFESDVYTKLNSILTGENSVEELGKKLKSVTETIAKLKGIDADSVVKIQTEMAELLKAVKVQGEAITSIKEGVTSGKENLSPIEIGIKNFIESDIFKNAEKNNFKGTTEKFIMKDVSFTSNFTNFTATPTPSVVVNNSGVVVMPLYQKRKLNVRDVLSKGVTTLPFVAFMAVTDWVNTIATATENESLPSFSFTLTETTTQKKRIGGHVVLSKDMLTSIPYIVSEIKTELPKKLFVRENEQLLKGVGTGSNVLGLFTNARDMNFAPTGVATSVTSIATFAGGTKTLVTFAAAHGLYDGFTITFAATTGGTYDNAYKVTAHSSTKIVIDQAYTADANVNANWTWAATHPLYHKIDIPTYRNVITSAIPAVGLGEFDASAIFMNKWDASIMEQGQDTTGQSLPVLRGPDGVLRIGGIAIVESNDVPTGTLYLGDAQNGAKLYQYQDLEVSISDDVSYKLKNQVVMIIEEQLVLAIFNQLVFMKVDLDAAVTALTKP